MIAIQASFEASIQHGFDLASFQAIEQLVNARHAANPTPNEVALFHGGWRGLAFRLLSCADDSDTFTASVVQHGTGPGLPERYLQDRALFAFFVHGLSAVESFCYALFGLGAIADPPRFPIATPQNLRRITPSNTSAAFQGGGFAADQITADLANLLGEPAYDEWQLARNELAHRIAPGRNMYLSTHGGQVAPDTWRLTIPIDLDGNTTPNRLNWLMDRINTLLRATHAFCQTRL